MIDPGDLAIDPGDASSRRRPPMDLEAPAQRPLIVPAVGAAIASGIALFGALALWGFTVDDAFIPARVAAHQLEGQGARFNPSGPVTDAVTPLGFAHWLALLTALVGGEAHPLGVLGVARVAGLCAWLAAAAILGRDLVRTPGLGRRELWVGWLALGSSVPLAAWAGSGLETAWVTLLATWALRRRGGADLSAGLAAAWRPELLPWAVVLCVVRAGQGWRARPRGALRPAAALVASAGPALGVALLRTLWFGRPLPLSALAKAPDLGHGLWYAFGVFVLSGPFWLLAGSGTWRACRAAPARVGASALAVGAHVVALVLAGGDWMPLYRLAVPVLPCVILLGVEVAVWSRAQKDASALWSRARRVVGPGLTLTAGALLAVGHGGDARQVMERRSALIEMGRSQLVSKRRIAAVDIGWIGAATQADLIDLAGVTDPRIAALPGGHTTKRISAGLLAARDVDALVFLVARGQPAEDWPGALFRYGVEARLARAASRMGFRVEGRIPLPATDWEYLVCGLEREPAVD